MAYSVYDYVQGLKGLEYPSEEYIQMRETVRVIRLSDSVLDKQTCSSKVALPKHDEWRHLFQSRSIHRHLGEDCAQGIR